MANDNTKNKISIATYGVGTRLDKESLVLSDIVRQTSLEVATKFGKRVDNKVVDTYTNMNLSNLFTSDGRNKNGVNTKKDTKELDSFRNLMQDNSSTALNMMTAEQGRINAYANYKSIVDNIPECALARDTYLANILSPDDYNKSIFKIIYTSTDNNEESKVKGQLDKVVEKYDLESVTTDIVSDVITYGDCFMSVLPYDREISKFLAQTSAKGLLNEGLSDPVGKFLDESLHLTERLHYEVLTEEVVHTDVITEEERSELNEAFGNGFNIDTFVTNAVNDNIKVKSVTELLRNRSLADNDILFSKNDTDEVLETEKKKKGKKEKQPKALNINGASLKKLDADRMVPIEVDGINYGYYYIEPGFGGAIDNPYQAGDAKAYTTAQNPMNPSLQPQSTGKEVETAANPAAKNLNISDDKLNLVSNILLKALGKKLNKEYINDNKQFKDLLYNLLKQKYIIEKGVSITYFLPEEVIHFKMDSIFSKIVFFAKIYLAILTNTVVIKLGRGHDKRIFYINSGADNNHEQAIMKVIQDVKTKEFKMSNLGSIASILSLNPGIMDDLYMPSINGEHPVDIDVIQGMDQEINNEFMDWLRKSMIQGTGLPSALLEAADNIEFAKQISAQNANFCRKIVMCQKQLTPEFTEMLRLLYKYEYQYSIDGNNVVDDVDINEIKIEFPSPGTLNLTNLLELFTQVDSAADYIAKRFIPDRVDQSTMDEQMAFKSEIIQDYLPQIDWAKYKDYYDKFKDRYTKEKMAEQAAMPPQDPGMGGY